MAMTHSQYGLLIFGCVSLVLVFFGVCAFLRKKPTHVRPDYGPAYLVPEHGT